MCHQTGYHISVFLPPNGVFSALFTQGYAISKICSNSRLQYQFFSARICLFAILVPNTGIFFRKNCSQTGWELQFPSGTHPCFLGQVLPQDQNLLDFLPPTCQISSHSICYLPHISNSLSIRDLSLCRIFYESNICCGSHLQTKASLRYFCHIIGYFWYQWCAVVKVFLFLRYRHKIKCTSFGTESIAAAANSLSTRFLYFKCPMPHILWKLNVKTIQSKKVMPPNKNKQCCFFKRMSWSNYCCQVVCGWYSVQFAPYYTRPYTAPQLG